MRTSLRRMARAPIRRRCSGMGAWQARAPLALAWNREHGTSSSGNKGAAPSIDLTKLTQHQLSKYSSYAVAGLLPAALLLSPSILAAPLDMGLALAVPLHAHLGMSGVIRDYAPPNISTGAQYALWVLTVLAVLGLLKLNFMGPGVSGALKQLWIEPTE